MTTQIRIRTESGSVSRRALAVRDMHGLQATQNAETVERRTSKEARTPKKENRSRGSSRPRHHSRKNNFGFPIFSAPASKRRIKGLPVRHLPKVSIQKIAAEKSLRNRQVLPRVAGNQGLGSLGGPDIEREIQ